MRTKFNETADDEVYVFHDRVAGRTVAAFVIPAGKGVAFARSQCSRKDQFCRKIGRHIAVGRAIKSALTGTWTEHTFVETLPHQTDMPYTPLHLPARRKWIIDRMGFLITRNWSVPFQDLDSKEDV